MRVNSNFGLGVYRSVIAFSLKRKSNPATTCQQLLFAHAESSLCESGNSLRPGRQIDRLENNTGRFGDLLDCPGKDACSLFSQPT